MNKFLTVDPGMTTGWALWTRKTLPEVGEFKINPNHQKNLNQKFAHMWFEFDMILKLNKPDKVYIEGVQYQGANISLKSGDLFTLCYLIGGYCNICDNYGIACELPTFRDWGGQLTMRAVKAQVENISMQEYTSQHIYDAVGIGLWVRGKL